MPLFEVRSYYSRTLYVEADTKEKAEEVAHETPREEWEANGEDVIAGREVDETSLFANERRFIKRAARTNP